MHVGKALMLALVVRQARTTQTNLSGKLADTELQLEAPDAEDHRRCPMDEDRSWLKNPSLPRPPAVPHFSRAELRLVEDELPSSVMRVAKRKDRPTQLKTRRLVRESGTFRARSCETARALQLSRRSA